MADKLPEPSEVFLKAAGEERGRILTLLGTYGQGAVKSLLLINGGAIIALLTFIGALLAKENVAQLRIAAAAIHDLKPALLAFGLGLSAAAPALAYVHFAAHEGFTFQPGDLHAWASGKTKENESWLGTVLRWAGALSVASGVLSIVCFVTGAIDVWKAFDVIEGQAWVQAAQKR